MTVGAQLASPLTATLVFDNPPPNATFDVSTPIKLHLVLKNVSGAPIITTEGFSATDFWRPLYFALDDFGIITNAGAAPSHSFVQYGTCHYRNSVIVPSVQVVPVEVLATDFGLQFTFEDARLHFDLSRAGRYTVTARLSFLAYGSGAVIDDCNIEFGRKSLLSIGDSQTAERQEFQVVSNALEFFIRPSDSVAPTTTANASPLPNAAGWNKDNVTVTLSAVDDAGGSGVKNIGVTLFGAQSGGQTINGASGFVGISAEGTTTVFFHAEDNAGNKEAVKSLAMRLDKTPPVVTAPAPIVVAATETGGARGSASPALAAFLVGGTATDNLDPTPVRLSPTADNNTLFPLGATIVVFRFRDVAGNIGTASSSVTVGGAPPIVFTFTGFFSPVNNLPTLNSVKAGSAVPVKFSLSGNQGLNIMAAGYPTSAVTTCSSTAPVDAVEETVTAGSSSLTYDPSTDQYIYVWKTDKAWTGCRQLVIKLTDGTYHRANFKVLK
jgi:hypothetical protein